MTRVLGLALVLFALAPTIAMAQACAPGRVVGDATAGHCCWPAQTWSDRDARCEGVPACPDGFGGSGAECVSLIEVTAPLLAPSLPTVVMERRVNYNVVGGGVALFVTSYGAGIIQALLSNGQCTSAGFGALPFFFPFGSFAGLACSETLPAITGLAFGLGQLIAVFLVAAGDSIFQHSVAVEGVTLDAEGLRIAF